MFAGGMFCLKGEEVRKERKGSMMGIHRTHSTIAHNDKFDATAVIVLCAAR